MRHSARTISRKLKEAALAWQLEQRWPKLRILTAYLNTIYFGNGAYGIQRAAQTYFNSTASRLTLPQAALLAGIPADPRGSTRLRIPRTARARRLEVLKAMFAQDEISRARPQTGCAHTAATGGRRAPSGNSGAGALLRQLRQAAVDREVRNPARFRRRPQHPVDDRPATAETRADARSRPCSRSPNGPSAALVSIRPKTGEVVAMYGGDNFRQSQFNLAVQGERQPGSSFKPFVLATALKQGISPVTTFPSKPVSIFIGDKYWPVHNYENDYIGSADLATATVVSDNSIFAQLTRLVGPANVAQDRARARHHPASESLLRDRARRRRRQPARDGARVLDVRERRPPGGQLWVREPSPRDRAHQQRRGKDGRGQPAGEPRRSRHAIRTRCSRASSKASSAPAPASAPDWRTAPSRGRRARRRTTAMRGSSGTRRSSRRPCGSGTRTS